MEKAAWLNDLEAIHMESARRLKAHDAMRINRIISRTRQSARDGDWPTPPLRQLRRVFCPGSGNGRLMLLLLARQITGGGHCETAGRKETFNFRPVNPQR